MVPHRGGLQKPERQAACRRDEKQAVVILLEAKAKTGKAERDTQLLMVSRRWSNSLAISTSVAYSA